MKSRRFNKNKKNKTHKVKSKNKTITNKICKITFKKISPATLLNIFDKKNVAIVNTLSNNIHINVEPININNCYGKDFIEKKCKELDNFKLIILYCANYTCPASHNYAIKLINKCKNLKNKIMLYEGGTNEWALLNFKFPDLFTFFDTELNNTLNKNQIEDIFLNLNHFPEKKHQGPYPSLILNNQPNFDLFKTHLNTPNNNSINNEGIMKNKVCVVTGGTSGLGLEVVKKLLDNDAKHVTLTFYHNKKRAKQVKDMLEKTYGKDRVYVLKADARTVEGNKLTFDRKMRKNKLNLDVGPIDCVDVNAGIFGPANIHKKHIHNINESDFKKTLDTNLNGYFLAMKYFAKQAIENNVINASIVCIKSIYGSSGSLFANSAYQTSKHGVMGLVRQSAIELARPNKDIGVKHSIRVNAVSPTFTDTALTKPFLDKKLIHDTIKNSNAKGHLAYKNDIAEAVMFLLSDKTKSITGIDLPVDCGVLAESIPTYEEVKMLNSAGINELSCCGNTL